MQDFDIELCMSQKKNSTTLFILPIWEVCTIECMTITCYAFSETRKRRALAPALVLWRQAARRQAGHRRRTHSGRLRGAGHRQHRGLGQLVPPRTTPNTNSTMLVLEHPTVRPSCPSNPTSIPHCHQTAFDPIMVKLLYPTCVSLGIKSTFSAILFNCSDSRPISVRHQVLARTGQDSAFNETVQFICQKFKKVLIVDFTLN